VRITSLEVTGFGPFKSTQVVDFRAFADDGLFLITGRTGAGKSSILDAICFALYGSVPRYDGAEQKLRSDHSAAADPTSVELEFTVDDSEYRVSRSPQYDRAKRSGTGTTPQKATAELFERIDGEWRGIAAKPSDVGPEILRIVGLTREQFLQVILLAQNRFQDFLLAKNDDRQKVLRNLFGTRRFELVEQAIVDRRRALDARISTARETLALNAGLAAGLLGQPEPEHVDLDWFENGFLALSAERTDAEIEARHTDEALTRADTALRAGETVLATQTRRDRALARLESLEQERSALDALRQELAAAGRAEILSPYIAASVAAERELGRARTREQAARTAYDDGRDGAAAGTTGAPEPSPADPSDLPVVLRGAIDETTRALGLLDDALGDERSIPALESEIAALSRRHDSSVDALRRLEVRSDALPAELEALAGRIEVLQASAGSARTDAAEVDRLTAALAAAETAAALEPQHAAARRQETTAAAATVAANTRILDLLQRRLAGHAAELAGELRDGEPCAVCGSPEHPAPAPRAGDPVTDADIDAAREAADRERRLLDAALAASAELTRALDEARTHSGGDAVDSLAERLLDARSDLREAERAARDASEAVEARARLTAEAVDLAGRLVALRADRETAGAALAAARSRLEAVDGRIRRSLAGYPSVSARADALRVLLGSATALLEAVALTASRLERAEAAASTLERALAEHGFDDAPAALLAARPASVVAAGERRLREFDDGVAGASATLAEPDVVAVPAGLVDLEPVRAARRDARERRDAALAAAAGLQSRVEQLNTIVSAAHTQLASSKRLHDEHRQLSELANAVEGKEPNDKRMRLETYVLAARLEEIVAAANTRLRTMTGGRYALEHDDALQYRGVQSGLGLLIRDEHTGRARPTHSLSGGETFLASLALALGLAEVVTNQAGGIRLDTLFVDEGFGSLDAETLAIAMGTLDDLRAGGRCVGLISHVEAMKEQIPAKLHVSVTADGCSEISAAYEHA
jgi:exonuclease SbcC